MSPVPVLTTQSLLAVGFAIPLLCSPADFLWLYGGATLDGDALYLARLVGAGLIAVSAITWLLREVPEGPTLDAICVGLGLGCAAGFAASIHHQLAEAASGPLGWTTVAVFGGLAIAYAALWLTRASRRTVPPSLQRVG
ncbi:MAG: hypothetical protein RJA99_3617 [Pseudomonadota bacterium]|jgi:hypothetical protein